MAYNPELVKELLGDKVAELFDGTIEIYKSKEEFLNSAGNLKVGDKFTFNLKPNPDFVPSEFVIKAGK